METISVSIIIPCHNVPKEYITRALKSIRIQTFRDYEVIVVDDGSTEQFSDILEQACAEVLTATLIKIPKSGVSNARNTGIRRAKGEFITFLDADDVLAADFLERALAVAEETGTDFVIGGVQETDTVSTPYLPVRTSKPKREVFTGERLHQRTGHFFIGIRNQIVFPGGLISGWPFPRLIKREIAQNTLFDPTLSIGEDLVWNLQALQNCRSVCIVQESWYQYWRNPNSAVHRYNPQIVEECGKWTEKVASLIDPTEDLMYSSYSDQVYECLRLIWFNYLSSEKDNNSKNYREITYRLYTERPWNEIGTKRYFRQVGRIKKITAILYRLKLYYAVLAWKEKIKPSDVCGGKKDST